MSLSVSAHVARLGGFNLTVDLSIASDRVTALYGHSGSGKTTLLRLITGLERQGDVTVQFNEQTWQDNSTFVPVHERRIGYVFQHLNLFPHLTAAENLEFAVARNRQNEGLPKAEVTKMLDLDDLLAKRPENLSGGEQQRVAIARALLSNPQLLVMDEPLGSIDAVAKARILPYLQRLHDTLNIPVIYVSHALDEVLELADDVILLESGEATQQSSVINFAIDGPDADLPQGTAMIHCEVVAHDTANDLTILNFENQTMYLAAQAYEPADVVRVRIPARDVSLALVKPEATSILNIFEGIVSEIHDDLPGPTAVVVVNCGEQQLLARITRKSLTDMRLKVDDRVYAQVKGVALMANHER